MKRKAFVAGVALLGLVAAGCGGSPEEAPTPPTEAGQQTSAEPPASSRTGPVKATDIADKCSIVPEDQSTALGADQAPRQRESNGTPGCTYQKGEAGTPGWSVFVAVAGDGTYQDEVAMREAPTSTAEVEGYPTSTYGDSDGCVVLADVSDQGYLLSNVVNTGLDAPGVDLCQKAEEFAKAAIQNLPNA